MNLVKFVFGSANLPPPSTYEIKDLTPFDRLLKLGKIMEVQFQKLGKEDSSKNLS